jgi:integrase
VGHISVRPDTKGRPRYRARTTGPDRNEHQKTFRRRTDAERWISEQENAVRRGDWADPRLSRVTVGSLAKPFIDTRTNLKPKTRAGMESLLRSQVMPVWKDRPLRMLSYDTATKWITAMVDAELSPSRIRQAYFVLKGITDHAVKIGYLPRNPMTGVALPRVVVRKEYVYLTRQELDTLAEAAGGPQSRDGLMVLVMGLCGLRWGELTGLRVQRVDGARARIMVAETAVTIGGHVTPGTPKSHEVRSVPVPPSLMASLATWVEGREKDALVFSDRKGGPIRDGNWARDALRPALKRVLDVPKLTAHDLRHTCACLLIRAGAPVKAVQEIMGHASPTVTLNVYSHLWPDDLDRWAAALDGHLTDMGITEDPR